MLVTQKCQYALRAIFDLARRNGSVPVNVAEIAQAQAIPARFLEVIMGQLKHAGFVASQRGSGGGYFLVRAAAELTVGEVVRSIQGPIGPVDCVADGSKDTCPLYGDCVFLPMWEQVREAMSSVYDNTTFQDLVDQEMHKADTYVPCYSI